MTPHPEDSSLSHHLSIFYFPRNFFGWRSIYIAYTEWVTKGDAYMRIIGLLFLLVLLVWPISTAKPSIPDRPIYEYIGDGRINFYNTHSDELLEVGYKSKEDGYDDGGVNELNYILRCRLTGERMPINLKLIALIDHVEDHFSADRVEVISGYRSPELNGMLRSRGRGVGKRSYHMMGMAIDIRIPGVPTKALSDYVASLRVGGVGYYPGPDFVHIDVGPVRYW